MKIKRTVNPEAAGLIKDWGDLGAALGVKTNVMSWVLHERDNMQKKIRLGEREVYKSAGPLHFIQNRLICMLEPMFNKLEGTEGVIAYRKGVTATDVVKNVPHARVLVSCDIRHYYDNVTISHIENCLVQMGMQPLGARLVARYCVVKKGNRHTLQQGSPASPVMSNIVGYFYFDRPIKEWLANHKNVNCTYLRYCDNIALFIHNDPPEEFCLEFKAFVKLQLKAHGNFRTHKWNTITDRNPVMHQKFLGIIVNAEARAELDAVDSLRAALFNCLRNGFKNEAERYLTMKGVNLKRRFHGDSLYTENFKSYLRGHINYVNRVSGKQGSMLKKLFAAAEYMQDEDNPLISGPLNDACLCAVKRYRNYNESVNEYLEKIKLSAE